MSSTLRESTRPCLRRKSQAGIELIIYLAFLLLIFSATYVLYTSKALQAQELKMQQDARKVAERIASEINAAVAQGSGYSKSFLLPGDIGGANYTVIIEAGTVFVEWSKNIAVGNIILDNVTGEVGGGWNQIENLEGDIFVNR